MNRILYINACCREDSRTDTPLIYPYFFVNLETLGVGGVLKWVVILLAAFIVVGFVFFGLDRIGRKNEVAINEK